MFDFELASARMGIWANDMQTLREQYPQLDFVWDRLEELEATAEEVEETHAAEMREMEAEAGRIEEWVSEARNELRRAVDEIETTVDEDDKAVRASYTTDALLVDLDCTRDQITQALTYLEGIGQ